MEDFFGKNNDSRFIGTGDEYQFEINGIRDTNGEQFIKRQQNTISEGMKKHMPIGSVVTLKGSSVLKMIIGFNYEVSEQVYDYLACTYPFGIDNHNLPITFNHDQIERVYHIGFINNQERKFKSELDLNEPEIDRLKK